MPMISQGPVLCQYMTKWLVRRGYIRRNRIFCLNLTISVNILFSICSLLSFCPIRWRWSSDDDCVSSLDQCKSHEQWRHWIARTGCISAARRRMSVRTVTRMTTSTTASTTASTRRTRMPVGAIWARMSAGTIRARTTVSTRTTHCIRCFCYLNWYTWM